jgi:hypothetical protein
VAGGFTDHRGESGGEESVMADDGAPGSVGSAGCPACGSGRIKENDSPDTEAVETFDYRCLDCGRSRDEAEKALLKKILETHRRGPLHREM